MLRIAQSSSTALQRAVAKRYMSSTASKKVSVLEGDSGTVATHLYHKGTLLLAVTAPVVFMVPDRWTDGPLNKAFGLFVAAGISAHSWIGLNYVATDYVPKISKALLGPARIVNAGIGIVTLLGLGRIAVSDAGIKGTIKGLWNPPKKEEPKKK